MADRKTGPIKVLSLDSIDEQQLNLQYAWLIRHRFHKALKSNVAKHSDADSHELIKIYSAFEFAMDSVLLNFGCFIEDYRELRGAYQGVEYKQQPHPHFPWMNPRGKICWHMAQGFCKEGEKCGFSHDPSGRRPRVDADKGPFGDETEYVEDLLTPTPESNNFAFMSPLMRPLNNVVDEEETRRLLDHLGSKSVFPTNFGQPGGQIHEAKRRVHSRAFKIRPISKDDALWGSPSAPAPVPRPHGDLSAIPTNRRFNHCSLPYRGSVKTSPTKEQTARFQSKYALPKTPQLLSPSENVTPQSSVRSAKSNIWH